MSVKKLKIVRMFNNDKIELINFNNVAKINLQYANRIILNFNHTITRTVDAKTRGKFSGYYYIDKDSVENYEEIRDTLFSTEFAEKFAQIVTNNVCTGFINVNEISSVKISAHNSTVIFNLSHSVTSQRQNTSLLHSAESVLSTFNDKKSFNDYVDNFMDLYA